MQSTIDLLGTLCRISPKDTIRIYEAIGCHQKVVLGIAMMEINPPGRTQNPSVGSSQNPQKFGFGSSQTLNRVLGPQPNTINGVLDVVGPL